MARAIDAIELQRRMCEICNQDYSDEPCDPSDCVFVRAINETPTLTPPNEFISRALELDELYTKLQVVTGFTAEQLLEMFAAGYTMEKQDRSKDFAEMANLANEGPGMSKERALTLARTWEQGHVCSLRDGEATEYHAMFAKMLMEAMPNEPPEGEA